ncbi:hypothetical protein SELMODRAFT_26754, partial [Selaginella moellendorffii]
ERNVVTWTSMLTAYAQGGHMLEARRIFDSMPERNVVSWTAMLHAYAESGHLGLARATFDAMPERNGLDPDRFSFMSAIAACSRLGWRDRGWKYFVSMIQDRGIRPSREHFSCVVDLLGRSGDLGHAEELVRSMPFSPDATDWGALLGASATQRDVDLAAQAAGNASVLEPEMASSYVLLA